MSTKQTVYDDYLKLLSKMFPNIQNVATELINLEAILNLPKGTEHFLSDIHGADLAFNHLMRSGSGIIRRKIDTEFNDSLDEERKNRLATLIYYPEETLKEFHKEGIVNDKWYQETLVQLVKVTRLIANKYTRSKVRKAIPDSFAYIIDEMLQTNENTRNKNEYYSKIIKTIITTGQAENLICVFGEVIQRLAVDHLHVLGDVYDRGAGPHKIIDQLMNHHSLDIQWGNHDMLWIGAASGSFLSILNCIRITCRYGHLSLIEEDYGINLSPLIKYADKVFEDVEDFFMPKVSEEISAEDALINAKLHKLSFLLIMKLESQFIERNPQYNMSNRNIINKINLGNHSIKLDDKVYPLLGNDFSIFKEKNTNKLTEEEESIMEKIKQRFLSNYRLQKHIEFIVSKGSIYKTYNGNLLLHGCIPMNEEGDFATVKIKGQIYRGKALLDKFEEEVRNSFSNRLENNDQSQYDVMWYLWTGENSCLFGKKAMKTFERYYIKDKDTHFEVLNPYYREMNKEKCCIKILKEFGLSGRHSMIINGHIPVKVKKGENPIKESGRAIVIDGGLARAYRDKTGIGGYTLVFNSYGMLLSTHHSSTVFKAETELFSDITSDLEIVYTNYDRICVRDTDVGKKLLKDIKSLNDLLVAYQNGEIPEKNEKKYIDIN